MKPRRTSLKDLADHLGVSIATVSRALRNSHEVGEEMTRKVKELAKQLNYRPNPFAQSLRKEAPRAILLSVPTVMRTIHAKSVLSTTSLICMWKASSPVWHRILWIIPISNNSMT